MTALGQTLVFSRSLNDGDAPMSQFDQIPGCGISAAIIVDDHAVQGLQITLIVHRNQRHIVLADKLE